MQRAWRTISWAAAAFTAYVVLGRASLLLASVHLSSTPVWPAAGFAIGLVAVRGLRWWPVVWAGAFVVNVTTLGGVGPSALIATGNALEALVAGGLLRRVGALEDMRGVLWLLGAAILGAAVSATVGSATLWAGGEAGATWDIGRTWFLGNLAGTLFVAPLWLGGWTRWRHGAVLLPMGLAVGAVAFATPGWSLVILVPVLAWGAIRRRHHDVPWLLLGLAGGAVGMTWSGFGPFAMPGDNEALLLLQSFLVALAVTVMSLSAGIRLRGEATAANWTGSALAMAPLLAAAAFIGLSLHPTLASLEEQRDDAAGAEVLAAWQDAVLEHGGKLTALRGLYEASEDVSRAEFDHFVARQEWTFGPGGSTAVGFVRLVEPADVAIYETLVRADLALPAVVREGFAVFPPPSGPAAVVDHVYPMDLDPRAIGLDLNADPEKAAALLRAQREDRPIATPPVAIVGPAGSFPGFFIALPAHRDGALIGFVVLAQTVADVAAGLEGPAHRVVDVTDEPQLLHEVGSVDEVARSERFVAWGRTWTLDIAPSGRLVAEEASTPWFVLAGASVLSVAVAGIVYAYDTTRHRARSMSLDLVQQARVDAQRLTEIRRLEDRDAFRRRFLSVVAHELRTPITPLKAQAFLMRRRKDGREDKGLDIMERGITRLSNVVDDLLWAARLESEGMALERADLDLFVLAGDAVEAARMHAGQDGTAVHLAGEAQEARVDGARIAQVLDNLLNNAMKFAKGGRIDVEVAGDEDEVIVEVRDDGVGIDPAHLEDVGQPFMQVHDPTLEIKGTGLGLSICKSIAGLHGGRLDITSEGLGKGTVARLVLPRRPDAD